MRRDGNDHCHRVYVSGERYPGINMSRSLGDIVASEVGLSNKPDVSCRQISSDMKFLVMGSDGVWEFMPNEEVAKIT